MKILKFTLITVLFIWLSHYAAAFPHEYAHSIMAWLLGFKQHALGIDYGGKSISNILTIKNINENNNYYLIYLLGGQHAIGWIAFAGPGIGNGGLYVLSLLCLLKSNTVKRSPYLYYFLFWFNLMCLGNLYSYVPLRTFTTHGDVGHMLFALSNPSPWWIFIPVGYVVMFLVYYFFSNTLPKAYQFAQIDTLGKEVILMILSVLLIFFYFALPGTGLIYAPYNVICQFLSTLSIAMIPAMIFICWPTRCWVRSAHRL